MPRLILIIRSAYRFRGKVVTTGALRTAARLQAARIITDDSAKRPLRRRVVPLIGEKAVITASAPISRFFRVPRVLDSGHLLKDPVDLAAIAEFVVIPDIKHRLSTVYDGSLGIKNTGVAGTDKIAGHHLR